MEDSDELPGPNPDSLEVVEEAPEGINPIPMRITYTSDSVSDYIALTRSGRQVTLDLAEPLLGVVRGAASLSVKIDELRSALAAVGIDGIIEHFTSVVARYTNEFYQ
ncbi:hypothetical protein [Halobacterium sp. CBA1126]|uniref:hypothetical protein n=1 Tax=Halobacterium sp. CBA1126 TaxID=2668074 RepID=UPI0012FC6B51|nr:hypothetical protein [Halobacterium sp. CBA1126]MUV61914.1 hypothetical protein [Halobacterium sp. CBA1126]